MPFSSLGGPVKGSSNKTVRVTGRFAGGGAAANCTKVTGCARGFTSVAYNAATGKYLVTLDAVGGKFLGGTILVTNAAGTVAAQKVCAPYGTAPYTAATRTLAVFVTDIATPTAADVLTTEELWLDLVFADTDAP